MPTRPSVPCSTPGCTKPAPNGGRCERCTARRQRDSTARRESPSDLGYDRVWRARRLDYLTRHPWCRLCGAPSNVADHWPRSRRELVAAGVVDPDADEHLRPLCPDCHAVETARNQPGGWHRWAQRPR